VAENTKLSDVVERLVAEGQLTRNTGTNSIRTIIDSGKENTQMIIGVLNATQHARREEQEKDENKKDREEIQKDQDGAPEAKGDGVTRKFKAITSGLIGGLKGMKNAVMGFNESVGKAISGITGFAKNTAGVAVGGLALAMVAGPLGGLGMMGAGIASGNMQMVLVGAISLLMPLILDLVSRFEEIKEKGFWTVFKESFYEKFVEVLTKALISIPGLFLDIFTSLAKSFAQIFQNALEGLPWVGKYFKGEEVTDAEGNPTGESAPGIVATSAGLATGLVATAAIANKVLPGKLGSKVMSAGRTGVNALGTGMNKAMGPVVTPDAKGRIFVPPPAGKPGAGRMRTVTKFPRLLTFATKMRPLMRVVPGLGALLGTIEIMRATGNPDKRELGKAIGGLLGGVGGPILGAAMGTMIGGPIGTLVGGLAGGIGGYFAGGAIGHKAAEWMLGDDPNIDDLSPDISSIASVGAVGAGADGTVGAGVPTVANIGPSGESRGAGMVAQNNENMAGISSQNITNVTNNVDNSVTNGAVNNNTSNMNQTNGSVGNLAFEGVYA
jgi:hypothetical protein